MLTPQDFNYQLPPELVAQFPMVHRDHSKLLVFKRQTQTWSHSYFHQLPQILQESRKKFLFVRNNSQVIPARLYGQKISGGHLEVFLVRQISSQDNVQIWECLTKPGLKAEQEIIFPDSNFRAQCLTSSGKTRKIQFNCSRAVFNQFLFNFGHTPIPPYIKSPLAENELRQVYQTTYAKKLGSVAAPTAGLHFTAELTQKLENLGFEFADVTLHVSLGTFLGVKTNNLVSHHLHTENYEINALSASKINNAIIEGKKIIAVGTTSTRVLETAAQQLTHNCRIINATSGKTQIFIYPPAKFQLINCLITNFHLPKSSLLMLVAAFCSQPNSHTTFTTWLDSPIGKAYQDCIKEKYRFFSFGDAMIIF